MKKLGFVSVLVAFLVFILMSCITVEAADYELTTHPVSSLDVFPATDPVSGDFIPVLDGSAGAVKKLDATNMFFNTDFFTSGYSGGATTIVSTVTPLTTANLAFGLVRFATGAKGVYPIPDGVRGKTVTFELILADTSNPTYLISDDTPGDITKTGWDTITFDTSRDRITLTWIDDASGWIIVSNDGCVITY